MAGRPNTVLNSPFRKEIDEFLANKKPISFIEKWLKKQGEPISRPTLTKYKKEDFNIDEVAHEIYDDEESQMVLNDAAIKKVDRIRYREKLIEKAAATGFSEMSDKEIHELGLKAAKAIDDWEKDEPETPDVTIYNNLDGFDEDERKNIKTLAQSLAKSDTTEQ